MRQESLTPVSTHNDPGQKLHVAPRPLRVLLVDDDHGFLELLSTALADDPGVEVVGLALDGLQATRHAARSQPDVVLMDIDMPVIDGLEATRSLRRLLPSARVVVVTSSASDADRCGARGAGAHAFLTKGLGSDALVEATLSAVSEPVR